MDRKDTPELTALRQRIITLVEVASACGAAVTLDELTHLLPQRTELTADQLGAFISSDSLLAARLVVTEGLVASKSSDTCLLEASADPAARRRPVAKARRLLERIAQATRYARFVGVSGSVVYGAPKPMDDVDVFMVAREGRLWLTVALMLPFIKVVNTLTKLVNMKPALCISYALSEGRCRTEFASNRTAMFAREALTVIEVKGSHFYSELLAESEWMREIYPRLYALRVKSQGAPEPLHSAHRRSEAGSAVLDALDSLIFILLGSYVKLRARMKLLSVRKRGNADALFTADLSKDAWIFTHRRYVKLARLYSGLTQG